MVEAHLRERVSGNSPLQQVRRCVLAQQTRRNRARMSPYDRLILQPSYSAHLRLAILQRQSHLVKETTPWSGRTDLLAEGTGEIS